MEDNAELELIRERIQYHEKYKELLTKKRDIVNGLIVYYTTTKPDNPLQALQYQYEAVKNEMDEFEIDIEINTRQQYISEFKERQKNFIKLQLMADEILKDFDSLLEDANSIMNNNSIPQPVRDMVKGMVNNLSHPEFLMEKDSVKNSAYVHFKERIDHIKSQIPNKSLISRVR